MAKDYYDVSYKTYFNDRIKPVLFRGEEVYPLYVQVTYDRRTIFFKSYYFELFARPKYDFLGTTISRINELESRVIDHLIAEHSDRFGLDELSRQYKIESRDVLDSFDWSFKIWMGTFFAEEGFPGLSVLLRNAPDGVAAIQLWDDLKKNLSPDVFDRMEEMAVEDGQPYLPLATYIRDHFPEGPFCLPLYEWGKEEKRIAIEEYLEGMDVFRRLDMGLVIRKVSLLLYPKRGF